MKILSLRFKNLNSLAGEWKIDFTGKEFEADGIFLIAGKTGSGKTTILDAICLALYGRTPRLANFSANVNEIMHRSSRECMAEVTFETSRGRYRSMWAQKRTSKAKKPFDAAMYKLEDADTGKCIGNTLGYLRDEAAKIIGMDFEQFTRAMLLAQGNFSAFLQSGPNDRAKILEQITGTEIYSKISKKIYDLAKNKEDEIKNREAALNGIVVLAEEEERELKADYAKCISLEKELDARCATQATAIDWLKKIRLLSTELDNLRRDEMALEKEEQAFGEKKNLIMLASRAESVAAPWEAFKSIRQTYENTYSDFVDQDAKLPVLEDQRDRADKIANEVRVKKEDKGRLFNEAMRKWEGARTLDGEIARQEDQFRSGQTALGRENEKCENTRREIENIGANLKKNSANLEDLSAWLALNGHDENLGGAIAALEQKFSGLEKCRQNGREKKAEFEKAFRAKAEKSRTLAALRQKMDKLRNDEKLAKSELQKAADKLEGLLEGRTLDDLRAQREELRVEKSRIQLLGEKSIEKLRAGLVDGEACPVCGSVHHPYANGNVPQSTEIDGQIGAIAKMIGEAEKQERQIGERQKAVDKITLALLGEEKEENRQDAELTAIGENAGRLEDECRKLAMEYREIEGECLVMLGDLGIAPDTGITKAIDLLRAKNIEIENKRKEKVEKETLQATLTERFEARKNALKDQESKISDMRQSLGEAEKNISEQKKRRVREYGEISRADVDKLEAELAKISKEEESAVKTLASASAAFAACKSRLELLTKQLAGHKGELDEKTRLFRLALAEQNFATENEFLAAFLPRAELDQLRAQERRLENRKTEIQGALKDKSRNLEEEKARNLTSDSLEILEAKQMEDQEARARNIENKGKLGTKIQQNDEARKNRGEREELLDRMRKDYESYRQLNKLIGSASGDNFKNFAQGLTFEILIAHANRQLAKMNDRYLLVMDKNSSLALNIVDNYQGGEIRSIKNLSGGESFIVSLALALGLANMGSRKTTVDSLFLDEGFGTLDEDTLETALKTLESLKREGKLIGIISHVPALRERLGTRLDVISAGAGKSRIEGPGCARL